MKYIIDTHFFLYKSNVKKYSLLHYIVEAGIPVWIDTKPAIAHNKVMIIDKKEVITGSFNFTDGAQKRNAENLVFITDPKFAKEFIGNWGNREQINTLFSVIFYINKI